MSKTDGFAVARGVKLPSDVATAATAIIAKRGAGKTYTAKRLVEEAHAGGSPIVVLDPVGAWWGLRSSSDGKTAGLPFTILGGEHGDLPLEPTSGEVVADLIIDENVNVVIDLNLMRKNEQRRFAQDFLETLYRRNRTPRLVVLEEADFFAPQKPQKEFNRLLGACEDLVRRGRSRGLGVVMVTQRSAVINKDVLNQADCLVVLRTTAPTDRNAVEGWVKYHGVEAEKQEFLTSLAGLETGEAWFWWPEISLFKRARVNKLRTFDSSATPELGETVIEPRKLADVDLQRLEETMAATIQKVKENDPTELKKRVRELEAEVRKAQAPTPKPEAKVERVEVPILTDADRKLLEDAAQALVDARDQVELLRNQVAEAHGTLDQLRTKADAVAAAKPPPRRTQAVRPHRPARPPSAPSAPAEGLTPAQQRILGALGWLESIGLRDAPKGQLAFLADASPKSSAFANNLGALRSQHGLIDYPSSGSVALTDAGRRAAAIPDAPLTPSDLQDRVRQKLPPAKWRILEALIDVYPADVAKDDLADAAGASPTSSAFANNLGNLRTLGLLDYPSQGRVVASPVLFLETEARYG